MRTNSKPSGKSSRKNVVRNEMIPRARFGRSAVRTGLHEPSVSLAGDRVVSDLDAMSLDDLQRHYDTYYSPNNATLLVVGDINFLRRSFPSLPDSFEPIPKGSFAKALTVTEAPQHGERRFLLKRGSPVPFVSDGVSGA